MALLISTASIAAHTHKIHREKGHNDERNQRGNDRKEVHANLEALRAGVTLIR